MNSSLQKAENIRDVIRYLQKFKNALVVIYLDDKTIRSPLFSSHIRDIALLHEAGLQVIIIPGARNRIDEILTSANISWTYKDNIRVTNEDAMSLIKMAAFDVSNQVMTSLAANNITAIIGNWVRSRGKGIINGFDYGTAGEIDKLEVGAIRTVLTEGFIPIFPCIGWNSVGHPYNISSISLAQQVAVNLKADKLFYLMENGTIGSDFVIPEGAAINPDGEIAAMDLAQAEEFLEKNKNDKRQNLLTLVSIAKTACQNGVVRTHIVDAKIDGVLPCEIFSDLGSGTMIYTSNYGKLRPMEQTDIPSVLGMMKPFVDSGKILPRTNEDLMLNLSDYIVYEFDGGIHACSALHVYPDGQAEIAAIVVDESFAHIGIGPKMMDYLISKAKSEKTKSIFIMTTQSADWFEKMGFAPDVIDSLPAERKAKWTPERNSKVYRLK
ncbi:MAG: amino-acid N-acetyltransferase [Treponema sp.]|nr:amino-acid N-acetyltransferase [Treponema sp.]